MKSIVTGSYAYGIPNSRSDIDLVVLVSVADAKRLVKLATGRSGDRDAKADIERYSKEGGPYTACLRYGPLNLIVCTNEKQLEVWTKGTKALRKRAKKDGIPISREQAVVFLKKLREEAGLV